MESFEPNKRCAITRSIDKLAAFVSQYCKIHGHYTLATDYFYQKGTNYVCHFTTCRLQFSFSDLLNETTKRIIIESDKISFKSLQ